MRERLDDGRFLGRERMKRRKKDGSLCGLDTYTFLK